MFAFVVVLLAPGFSASPASADTTSELVTNFSATYTSELVVVGDYAYVASDTDISIIDTGSNSVVSTVSTSGATRPDGAAAIGTTVYFAAYSSNKIIIFDTQTQSVSYLATTGCTNPSQLRAVSSTRLVANCHGSGNVQVYDVTVPAIAGTVTTGPGPRGMSVNNGLVFVPNSLGGTATDTMTVVDAAATPPTAVTNVTVGDKPEFTGYLDGKIFVANFNSNTVSIVDATSYSVVATVAVGNNPQGLAACSGNMYSANRWTGNTSVMSPTSDSVINTIELEGVGAITHVVGANDGYAYFLNFSSKSVSVVDCGTETVLTTIDLSHNPSKVAFSSEYAYVTSPGSPGTISVLSLPVRPAESFELPGVAYADFSYFLPDGRECTSISPQRVRVGAMVMLPGETASCQTAEGSLVAGWVIPVPHGFTGYGSSHEPFPPGLPVRVVESQRFTLVPFEPVMQINYDANIADDDACTPANLAHASDNGRVGYSWVPRAEFAAARTWSQAPCVPDGHELAGWNTAGDGSGESIELGAPLPALWETDRTNSHRLYAMWTAS